MEVTVAVAMAAAAAGAAARRAAAARAASEVVRAAVPEVGLSEVMAGVRGT